MGVNLARQCLKLVLTGRFFLPANICHQLINLIQHGIELASHFSQFIGTSFLSTKILCTRSNFQHGFSQKEAGAYERREVTRQFNAMLDQIDQLMADVRRQEEATRQYELQALSSQINPHFLYNTLDTIIWMAEFQDSQRVVQVTKSLATYFRLALNQGKDLISLSDEINHVRQYLFIQKQRYGDKLEYEIAEEPDFDNLVLPKLVLQPLVENALYHGIKEKEHHPQCG